MKLALGTAQFGLDYGVSNVSGRVPFEEVAHILKAAEAAGVDLLDTAWAYGDAEAVLGSLGAPQRFRIVTKTAPLSGRGVGGVLAEFEESLTRLGMASVYGLLVHSADDLLGESGSELAAALQRCRTGGLVEKIGVSAYTAPQLFAALDVLDADLVQVPVNAFDQRLVNGGALAEIEARGIEVHVRSAFLQGLLLMSPAELPAYFEPIRPHMEAWRVFCAARGMTPLAAALGFVLGLPQVDQVVVGVESAAQLAEIVTAVIPLDGADFRELALTDADMIDPTRWPR